MRVVEIEMHECHHRCPCVLPETSAMMTDRGTGKNLIQRTILDVSERSKSLTLVVLVD